MVQYVGEVSAVIGGDIGGLGVSRFHFKRNDGTIPTPADCGAAAAAVQQLYFASRALFPLALTITTQVLVIVRDEQTALVSAQVNASPAPAAVTGTGAGNYGAGLGIRINWKTTQVHNRRFIRGNTFMVPLVSTAFTASGACASTAQTTIANAAVAYLAAINAAACEPVVWARPHPLGSANGTSGIITAVAIPSSPAGLRSRRS